MFGYFPKLIQPNYGTLNTCSYETDKVAVQSEANSAQTVLPIIARETLPLLSQPSLIVPADEGQGSDVSPHTPQHSCVHQLEQICDRFSLCAETLCTCFCLPCG